ncbi:cation transporter [Xanthobacter sp. KR7-225]|uniref:cation diffusion facilitator family transporter n=1 Tax=Xanthobacter sp. KR7-225 TaxID=3156613 RepID=UPI0032B35AB0
MREPSESDRLKEHAILFALLLDVSVFLPYAVTVWRIGSLAMLAELLRGGLLLIVEAAALATLRAVHRGRTYFYEFGVGKLERMLSAGIGVLLIAAAGVIVAKVVVAHEQPELPPAWAAAAIALVVYNLVTNVLPLAPLWRATRAGTSIIVASQFRGRVAKAAASVTVVACVAVDALSGDRELARVADDVGGLVGATFMVVVGAHMIYEALPDLLDRALAEPLQVKVNAALAASFESYEQLIGVRTRRSGSVSHVEITVAFDPARTIADVGAATEGMRNALRHAIPEVDVVVIAVPVAGTPPAGSA